MKITNLLGNKKNKLKIDKNGSSNYDNKASLLDLMNLDNEFTQKLVDFDNEFSEYPELKRDLTLYEFNPESVKFEKLVKEFNAFNSAIKSEDMEIETEITDLLLPYIYEKKCRGIISNTESKELEDASSRYNSQLGKVLMLIYFLNLKTFHKEYKLKGIADSIMIHCEELRELQKETGNKLIKK